MPNLSSLFTKFLFRETLTTEEKTAIRGDIGVPAPPTTESVLALLDGSTLPASTIELGDASALTLASGVLAGDGDGDAVVGDGVTLGGNRLAFASEAMPAFKFYQDTSIVADAGGASSYFKVLETIAIPTEMQTTGSTIVLEIDVILKGTCNNKNALGIAFKHVDEGDLDGNIFPVASLSKGIHTFRGVVGLTCYQDVVFPPDHAWTVATPDALIAGSFDSGGTFGTPAIGASASGFVFITSIPMGATNMQFGVYISTSDASISSGTLDVAYSFRATLTPA